MSKDVNLYGLVTQMGVASLPEMMKPEPVMKK